MDPSVTWDNPYGFLKFAHKLEVENSKPQHINQGFVLAVKIKHELLLKWKETPYGDLHLAPHDPIWLPTRLGI